MKKRFALWALLLLALPPVHAQKPYRGDGPDDVLRLVPLGGAVAMKACGVESRDSWSRFALNAALSTAVTAAATYTLKQVVHETRPDGTDRHAFPSGHAALAFSGAHIFYKEYKDSCPWGCVAAYAVAGATAVDRVRRHRHGWGDVGAGAAVGILSAELSYYLGDKLLPSGGSHCAMAVSPAGFSFQLTW